MYEAKHKYLIPLKEINVFVCPLIYFLLGFFCEPIQFYPVLQNKHDIFGDAKSYVQRDGEYVWGADE